MYATGITPRALSGLALAGLIWVVGCSGGGGGDAPRDATPDTRAMDTDVSAPVDTDVSSPPASPPGATSAELSDATFGDTSPSEPPPDPRAGSTHEPSASDDVAPASDDVAPASDDVAPESDGSAPASEDAADQAASVSDGSAVDGPVAVADTKPGLTRIGAVKCKICHKVQYASWAESEHALRTPPLDCESCHGSGSEYKKKSIMQDPELARAAGLVIPDRSFCTGGPCHQDGWEDDMIERAHAHATEDD